MTGINLCSWSKLLGDKKLFVPIYWKVCRRTATELSYAAFTSLMWQSAACWESASGLEQEEVKLPQEPNTFLCWSSGTYRGTFWGSWGKGSSSLAILCSQRTASWWALAITSISHGVEKPVCLQPLRATGRKAAPNQLCWGGCPGALSAGHRTGVLHAESSLYLWGFTWVVMLSWVWTGFFVLCRLSLALVLLTLCCVHLKLPIFFVSVARGSCTVTFCWGKRKRNYSLPDLDGSNMLWCLPAWTASARHQHMSESQFRTIVLR